MKLKDFVAYQTGAVVSKALLDVAISGKTHHLNEDEMIIMPANKPHAVKAITKFKMILIMIRAYVTHV
jgi:quercetin dioxygenase-like cupin family protein